MNLAALHTLTAIIDHGSFAAAAAEVGCTPSAVSLQVKQMEQFFGQPLFDRSTRSVRPTPFALEAGRAARECVARVNALRARPTMAVAGRWRLGAIATAQTDALPAALRHLRDSHPALNVMLTVEDSGQLIRELKAARIDGAVVVRPADGGATRALHWVRLAAQRFVMLAPADVPVASPQQLLLRHGWIRHDTSLTGGRAAARHVQRIAPNAVVRMDLRPIDAIIAMVSAGLGVSVVPQPRQALLDAHRVTTVPLGRGAPTRQLCFVCRAADADHRNTLAVLEALRLAYGE